jgi:hypothetical protein
MPCRKRSSACSNSRAPRAWKLREIDLARHSNPVAADVSPLQLSNPIEGSDHVTDEVENLANSILANVSLR